MTTGVDVSKLTAYAATGTPTGVTVSKVVAFVVLSPGTESGGTPPAQRSYTYAQRLRNPNA
jgi:hypothetical protein